MSGLLNVEPGSGLSGDLSPLAHPWKLASQDAQADRVLTFDSWDSLSILLTAERYRLLRHLRSHPEKSVDALAAALGRQFQRVHEDVSVLEMAGLVDSSDGEVRVTADKLNVVVAL
jgi:predicted transcriptional regulator